MGIGRPDGRVPPTLKRSSTERPKKRLYGPSWVMRLSAGAGAVAAVFLKLLPLEAVKAAVKEKPGPLEKNGLKIGFVPITCATPIIMAGPIGFYSKYGLDVELVKTAGWAVMRDKALIKEYDAEQMLTPMPLRSGF